MQDFIFLKQKPKEPSVSYLPSKDIAVCLIGDFDCPWDNLTATKQLCYQTPYLISIRDKNVILLLYVWHKETSQINLAMRTGGLDCNSQTKIFPSLLPDRKCTPSIIMQNLRCTKHTKTALNLDLLKNHVSAKWLTICTKSNPICNIST